MRVSRSRIVTECQPLSPSTYIAAAGAQTVRACSHDRHGVQRMEYKFLHAAGLADRLDNRIQCHVIPVRLQRRDS